MVKAQEFVSSKESEKIDASIASAPCDADSVPALLADVATLGQHFSADNRSVRLELLEKARSLVRALETPRETMLKHVGGQTAAFLCLTIGNDTGLFKHMAAHHGSPKSVSDLANTSALNSDVLARILRHLASMGYIEQTAPDAYKPTNFTRAMAIPSIGDSYPLYAYAYLEPLLHFHKWLQLNQGQVPTDISSNPHNFGHRTNMPFYDWLHANQPLATQFNHHMTGYRLGRPSWMDPEVYPVQENLVAGFNLHGAEDPVILVDIGGSYGHDLEEFRRKHPGAPGRLILQDLARVLEKVTDLQEDIEMVPYDFLTPQPVKGARAYYIHAVLHNYPDDRCFEIIEQIKGAMKPGYSKLLINEHIIPLMGANWESTYLELYMMVLLSARERTEDDWRNLLEKRCGLRICKFWNPGSGVEGIIECELPL